MRHNTFNQTTGGIWRVTGPGGTAIFKHLTPNGDGDGWAASADPHHWNYWEREYLAYTTGSVERYCADTGLAAPALLAAAERSDGSRELWLEAVDGRSGGDLTVAELADAARALGRAQARAAAETPEPWHSRHWLRQYTSRRAYTDIPWDHPVAAAYWPDTLRTGLRRLWESRDRLCALGEAAPQTVCHLDVWPMNLIARGRQTVLIDWAFTGAGAIGEDIANLIPDTFFDGLVPVEQLEKVAEELTAAYLAGLADAGWRGSTDKVRAAIAASGAAKYAWLAPTMLVRLAAGHGVASADYDPDSADAEVFERRRPVFAMLLSWAHRALEA